MKIFVPLVAILMLSACSEDTRITDQQTDSRVSKDNVFSDQVRALEKAEKVEEQMMEAFHRRNTAINTNSR